MEFFDINDYNVDDDSESRPTENAAITRAIASNALAWRKQRWGAVYMTEREYEAVVLERREIERRNGEYRDLDRRVSAAHKERLTRARDIHGRIWVQAHADELEQEREAALDEGRKGIERNIQARIAKVMCVTQPRVSQLLKSANTVMLWLAVYQARDYTGWQRDKWGAWELIAPVATITKTAKIIAVNFEPERLIKSA